MFARKTYQNLSDENLMRDIVKGNERAFEELYDRYSGRMHHYFYKMLYQDSELANDFTQDLFMKIIEKPHLFDANRKFSTWIYTVAGNMVKNEYRKNGRHQITNNVPEQAIPECQDYFPDEVDKQLFQQHLQTAVNDMEDPHKQIFVLRFQEEKSVKQIAEIVGCPEGTVKSRIFYSLKKLSNKLKVFSD